jgi:hypothetical protein
MGNFADCTNDFVTGLCPLVGIGQVVTYGVVLCLPLPTTLSACATPSAVMAAEKVNRCQWRQRDRPHCRVRPAAEEAASTVREAPLAQGEGAEVEVTTKPNMTDEPISSFVCPDCVCLQSCSVEDVTLTARPSCGPPQLRTRAYTA